MTQGSAQELEERAHHSQENRSNFSLPSSQHRYENGLLCSIPLSSVV